MHQDIEFYDQWHQAPLQGENALKTRERQHMLRSLLDGVEGRLLVIGCGGAGEMMVVPDDATAVGLDISPIAVSMSRRSAPQHQYVVADAAHLPFRSGSARAVLCSEVIEHVRDSKRALEELGRVLDSEGYLVLTTPNWLSFYGLARLAGRLLLRRDFTSGDQPYDRWSTRSRLDAELRAANHVPQRWFGFWYFPPFGKGKFRLPERLLTSALQRLMPLDRYLRPRLPALGHVLLVVSRRYTEGV